MQSVGKVVLAEPWWRAAAFALLLCGCAVEPSVAQTTLPSRNAGAPQDDAAEAVTCFAGCSGAAGQVIARPNLPAQPAIRSESNAGSGWRPVGQNNWCHDKLGCRTQTPEEPDPNKDRYRRGVYCSSYNGLVHCNQFR